MACEIRYDGGRHGGIVTDISRTGLFVQSGTPLPLRTLIEVEFALGSQGERVLLRAHVARRVARNLLAKGGIGLHIVEAPPAYFEAVESLSGDSELQPPARPRFRVRVKQLAGPRSRVLVVEAETADEARGRALASLAGDWEALAVEPL